MPETVSSPMDADKSSAAARLFANAQMRNFLVAWALSNAALWAWAVTIATVTFQSGGAPAVAAALAARLLPGAVSAPVAAVLAANMKGHNGIRLTLALRIAAMLTGSLVLLADWPIWMLYAAIIAEGMGSGPMHALHIRVLPLLSRQPDELAVANSLTEFLRAAGVFLGPCICGVVLYLAAAPQAIWLCCVFLVMTLALLPSGSDFARTQASGGAAHPFAQIIHGVKETLRAPRILLLVCISMLSGTLLGSLQLLMTAVAIDTLKWGSVGPSILLGLVGLGGLVGGGLSMPLARRRNLRPPLALGMAGVGASATILGTYAYPVPVSLACACGGMGLSLLLVMLNSLLQRNVPLPIQAAVFGFSSLLQFFGIALGGALSSTLVQFVGLDTAPIIFGCALIFVSVGTWLVLRAFVPETDFDSEAFRVVRQSGFFQSLAIGPSLQLAAAIVPVEVRKGDEVITYGDLGEDAYLIESGRLHAIYDGKIVNRLGPGDVFGEIALLEDIPRTATVTAVSDARIWRLNREAFLYAVTGTADCFRIVTDEAQKRLDIVERLRREAA